jgi:hypothetical protein
MEKAMGLIFPVPPHLEQRLREEAERTGLSIEECAFRALDQQLPPRNQEGLSDFELDGVRCQLVRLSDRRYRELRARSIPIQEDDSYLLRFMFQLENQGKLLQLGQVYAALRELFGESSECFDDWKGSFCFPFSLSIRRASGTFHYLFDIHDWKAWVEFGFRKVIEGDLAGIDRSVIRQPFADEFSKDVMNRFVSYVYGYLRGYCKTAFREQGPEPFLRQVPAKQGLYGYCNGRFFEQDYPSDGEYEEAREAYRQAIEREKPQHSEDT